MTNMRWIPCRGRMSLWPLGWLALGVTALAASAQKSGTSTPKSFWDQSFNLRVAGGYKDNVLLGHTQPIASALINSALDVMVLRLPTDGAQFYFFVNADDLRYQSGGGVDKEQLLLAQTQLK